MSTTSCYTIKSPHVKVIRHRSPQTARLGVPQESVETSETATLHHEFQNSHPKLGTALFCIFSNVMDQSWPTQRLYNCSLPPRRPVAYCHTWTGSESAFRGWRSHQHASSIFTTVSAASLFPKKAFFWIIFRSETSAVTLFPAGLLFSFCLSAKDGAFRSCDLLLTILLIGGF